MFSLYICTVQLVVKFSSWVLIPKLLLRVNCTHHHLFLQQPSLCSVLHTDSTTQLPYCCHLQPEVGKPSKHSSVIIFLKFTIAFFRDYTFAVLFVCFYFLIPQYIVSPSLCS